MKLKKIIIVYPSFERGGIENILVNLINELVRKKILVEIITISNKLKSSQLLKPSKYLYINYTIKKIDLVYQDFDRFDYKINFKKYLDFVIQNF